MIPKWGSTPVARIQFDGIAKWLGDILADSVSNGKPLSASTIRKIHVVLKRVLDHAVRARRIAYNPAIGIPLPRYVPPEHVYLENMQQETLVAPALVNPWHAVSLASLEYSTRVRGL
ncbi:hypothetical protein [Kitasatospora sp. NPDC058478]|uniref:hypothetical protein n=1 Tax=unclassified Kitasatospora TaxID=2633591 RepID=UPI00365473C7